MITIKHSKNPWKAFSNFEENRPDTFSIATSGWKGEQFAVAFSKEAANKICLAVNNHEKLMEILRLFVENKKDIPENTILNNLLYEAKCLLAHIEGNSL